MDQGSVDAVHLFQAVNTLNRVGSGNGRGFDRFREPNAQPKIGVFSVIGATGRELSRHSGSTR